MSGRALAEDRELAEAFAAYVLAFGTDGLAALKAEAERTGERPSEIVRAWALRDAQGQNGSERRPA